MTKVKELIIFEEFNMFDVVLCSLLVAFYYGLSDDLFIASLHIPAYLLGHLIGRFISERKNKG